MEKASESFWEVSEDEDLKALEKARERRQWLFEEARQLFVPKCDSLKYWEVDPPCWIPIAALFMFGAWGGPFQFRGKWPYQ